MLEPLLPVAVSGRPAANRRKLIDGIRWRVRTGAPWRDLPAEYGPWQTVYGLFRRWAKAGIMHPVIGYATEIIEIWFADELTLHERNLDDGEFLDVFPASLQELEDWMRDGELTDVKTIVGMMWLQKWRAGAWALEWVTLPD